MAYSPRIRQKARSLYKESVSCEEIAKQLGINPDTIYRWRRKEGWDESSDEGRIEAIEAQIDRILAASRRKELTDKQVRTLNSLTRTRDRIKKELDKKLVGVKTKKQKRGKKIAIEKLHELAAEHLHFHGHQTAFHNDTSMRRIAKKARQTGFSYAVAYELLENSARDEQSIVASASERQARIIINYMHKLCELMGIKLEKGREKGSLCLPGGADQIAVPTSMRTAQGFSGHLYLDEFAWVLNGKEFFEAVQPSVSEVNGRITIFSTPYTESTHFEHMWKNMDHFSKHFVTIHDAVENGMHHDIDYLRKDVGDAFRYLYECEQWDDESSLFDPVALLECCQAESTLVEDLRDLEGDLYGGTDIGRTRDATVEAYVEADHSAGEKEMPMVTLRHLRELKRMALDAQQAELEDDINSVKHILIRMNIDRSGLGRQLAEYLAAKFPGLVMDRDFTMQYKSDLALNMRELIAKRRYRMPHDPPLIAQFLSIKKVARATGFSYDAKRDATGHADSFWSIALAADGLASGPGEADDDFRTGDGRRHTKTGRSEYRKGRDDFDFGDDDDDDDDDINERCAW